MRRICLQSFHRGFSSKSVSAALVKELRVRTNAPMMDCKKALMADEVNGDISKAMDWLRAKGIAKASNQERKASEGLVGVYFKNDKACLIEINSETDFIGMNKDFQSFLETVAKTAHEKAGDGLLPIKDLLTMPPVCTNNSVKTQTAQTITDLLGDIISSIREQIVIRRVLNISSCSTASNKQLLSCYVHGKVASGHLSEHIQMGKALAFITLDTTPCNLEGVVEKRIQDMGRKLAMHVIAAKPMYLSIKDVPEEALLREKAIMREQTDNENAEKKKTPAPELVDKVVNGRLQKRLGELCLLTQSHLVEEGSPVMTKFLDGFNKTLSKDSGMDVSVAVSRFERWTLGQHESNAAV